MSEKEVIKTFKKLERGMPKSLWLFTNGQQVYLMRKHDGQRVMDRNGSVDSTHCIASFSIESDGGDW